ncbi:MAG: hypothetical protein ACKO2V_12860 [Snowella sp.]
MGGHNLPLDWNGCLLDTDLEEEGNGIEKIGRIKDALLLGLSIAQYFRNHSQNNQSTIIFLERFIHLQLFSLAVALFLIPRKNIQVWLLYRRDAHHDKTRSIYKFLHQIIHQLLPKNQFKFLTDSELLANSLSDYFQEKITVMPIPHTDISCPEKASKRETEIFCWWPGSPRLEKGWDILKYIAKEIIKGGEKICFITTENANLLPNPKGINLKTTKNNLTREEYLEWLCLSDIILLPYHADAYKERTSGIFTECIIAGKIPLVTPNTWMAQELKNYQLEDLIIDWDNAQKVCDRIISLMANPSIHNQIMIMQKDFKQFHNLENYAQTMQDIFDKT